MAAGKVSDAQRRAKDNYNKRKGRRQRIVEFYETEHADILAHLDAQPNKSAYIRELIRRDMEVARAAVAAGEPSPAVAEAPKSIREKRPEDEALFRYSNGFEDVFIEDDHYLYANAGRFGSATRHPATPYTAVSGTKPLRGARRPVTRVFLEGLDKAPADIASSIIEAEHAR